MKRAAAARARLDPDPPAVGLGDSLHDRKPEADSPPIGGGLPVWIEIDLRIVAISSGTASRVPA